MKHFGVILLFVFALVLVAENTMSNDTSEETRKGDIIIMLDKFKNDKGQVFVVLYKSKEHFLKDDTFYKRLTTDIVDGKAQIIFEDIPYGMYAFTVCHDENKNNKMDTRFKMPKEGYAFSNNAKNLFGPPGFDKAKIVLKSEKFDTQLSMQYLFGQSQQDGKKNRRKEEK